MAERWTPPVYPATPARDLSGATVGRFTIEARLGTGGMGEVYRARDKRLRRTVALKRIPPRLFAGEESRERLWKEAQNASRLNDAHIAAVHDVFEHNGDIFLVMEYVEGQTLRQRFSRPLSIDEFLSIATQCAAGLAAAQRHGIQHRDLKPENILVTPEGHVKILDFGIARQIPGFSEATTVDSLPTEGFTGTYTYMAPEMVRREPSDGRADLFSLGIIFYEALAQRHPFRSATLFETLDRILRQMPEPVSKFNAEAPPELDGIIARMLAKHPDERYSSATELLADLEELRRRREEQRPASRKLPVFRRAFRAKRFWIPTAATIVALAILAWLVILPLFRKPVLAAHAPILISDFENRTGQKVFDQTVTEAVRESLEQSRYFRIIPRSQVHDAAQRLGRGDVARVDRALGRELCQADNCRAVLTGSIIQTGARYQIMEELIDPAKDSTVLVESASMDSPTDLFSAVDALTKKLRRGIGESLAQISQSSLPLAQVTTSSLLALQRYSQALDLYTAGNIEAFLPLAQSAVALDPNFAMAHLYLARAYDTMGNEKQALEHLAAAKRNLDRVTERERYLILADDYAIRGDYDKAIDEFRLLTEVYPDDLRGFAGLAQMSTWTGRIEEAVPAERRALELDPHSAVDHLNLILDLDRLNQFDEAITAYSAARNTGIKSPLLYWGSGLAYLGKGDTAQAMREFQLLGAEGGEHEEDLASFYLARVLMYQGHLRRAADELRKGLVLDEKTQSEGYMPVRHYLLADTALVRGDAASARAEGEQMALRAARDRQAVDLRRAGEILIRSGALPAARKTLLALSGLRREYQSNFDQSCYYSLEGWVELAQNNGDTSIASQHKASVLFPLYSAYLGLGDALAAKHDWNDAATAYEKYLSFEGQILQDDSPSQWVLAHLTLARTLARAGKNDEAQKYYGQFLKLWAHADADLAPPREARAEQLQLSKTDPSAPEPARTNPK